MDLANRSHIRNGSSSSRPSTSASQPNLRRPRPLDWQRDSAPELQQSASSDDLHDAGWGGPIVRPSTVGTSKRPLPPVRHQGQPRTTNVEESRQLVARSRLLQVGRIVESSVRRRESEDRLDRVKDFERQRWSEMATPGLELSLDSRGGGALWRNSSLLQKHSTRKVNKRLAELQRQLKALSQSDEARQQETKRRTEEREARASERREACIAERVSSVGSVLAEEQARTSETSLVWSVDNATGIVEWDGEQLRESRGLSLGKEVVASQLSPRSRSDLGQALTDKGEQKEEELAKMAARRARAMERKRQQREMKTERTLVRLRGSTGCP